MTGARHGGKGDKTRPEAAPGNFSKGHEGVDWDARERDFWFHIVDDVLEARNIAATSDDVEEIARRITEAHRQLRCRK